MPKVHLELNENYQLELNLFKMLYKLDDLKGEDFSLGLFPRPRPSHASSSSAAACILGSRAPS